jgi:hypothetical protein
MVDCCVSVVFAFAIFRISALYLDEIAFGHCLAAYTALCSGRLAPSSAVL